MTFVPLRTRRLPSAIQCGDRGGGLLECSRTASTHAPRVHSFGSITTVDDGRGMVGSHLPGARKDRAPFDAPTGLVSVPARIACGVEAKRATSRACGRFPRHGRTARGARRAPAVAGDIAVVRRCFGTSNDSRRHMRRWADTQSTRVVRGCPDKAVRSGGIGRSCASRSYGCPRDAHARGRFALSRAGQE